MPILKFRSGTDRIQNQLEIRITASNWSCLLPIHADTAAYISGTSLSLKSKGHFPMRWIHLCFLWNDSLCSSTSLYKNARYPYSIALAIIIHYFSFNYSATLKNKKNPWRLQIAFVKVRRYFDHKMFFTPHSISQKWWRGLAKITCNSIVLVATVMIKPQGLGVSFPLPAFVKLLLS